MSKEQNKKLTEQQKENIKKYVIFSLMFLAFAGIMYYLFAPKTEDSTTGENTAGMNVSIPEASNTNLLGDKKTAYENQLLEEEQEKKEQAISDLSQMFGGEDMIDNDEYGLNAPLNEKRNAVHTSVSAYRDIHNTLDNFYVDDDNSETEELRQEIATLKRQLEEKDEGKDVVDRQLEMMEKSYQMASKYLPMNNVEKKEEVSQRLQPQRELEVKAVKQYQPLVVSSLQGTFSDNYFSTAVGEDNQVFTKNTIKACIHKTMSISQGESLPIRLLEDIIVGDVHIPSQTILMAIPQIRGNRMLLSLTSLQYKGTLLPVKLSAYDIDGQEGLFVPGTIEQNAVKEVLSGIGKVSGSTSTFSMNNSVSQQLLTDMGKGVIQGTSNYLSRKIQDVKIQVKAGHSLLLYSQKENQ